MQLTCHQEKVACRLHRCDVMWCIQEFEGYVMSSTTKPRVVEQHSHKSIRTSVSLPPELHETLEHIAKGKKVSVAWVIRDAAEKYVSEQWPLLQQERA